MKRTRQDVESELRSLLPNAPSDRVLDSITSQLAPTRRTMRWENARAWRAVALAVAASIAVAVWWWPQPGKIPGPSPSLPIVDRQPQETADMPPPTMLAYQHVWGHSPEELDELLDRHAASFLVGGPPSDDIGSLYRDVMSN